MTLRDIPFVAMATEMQWFGGFKVVCHELLYPWPVASWRPYFLEDSVICLCRALLLLEDFLITLRVESFLMF